MPAKELEAHPARPADQRQEISLQVRDPGRYQIIAEHGRGGVGRVLRATDRELGRDVAVKELLRRTPLSESRFLREAIITSRLEHPNIVPVHEAGRWPDDTPFYAMKLVSGRPLTALIDQARTYADRLTLLDRVLAVADAIAYAHVRGVIHRDLKPSNVIVGDYGETIVIDWGLAKQLSDPDDEGRWPDPGSEPLKAERTKTGMVLGTPAYMAPEQAFGGAVTRRTDVYALGAILLDVLAGRTQAVSESADPFASTDGRSAIGMGTGPRALDGRTPAALRSIVRCAMAMSPWDRYADAKEFGDDLRRFLAGKLVAAHRYTRGELVGRWLGSHRRLVQGSAAVLVALLAASVWFLARESRLRGEAEVARRAADQARGEADQARRTAESERDRADRQTIALLEQQGRAELAAAHPFRAAPILAEAYRRDPGNVRVRWLLTDALRALDSLTAAFTATLPGSDPNHQATFSVSLSPDDSELVIGHRHEVSFWDPISGELRRQSSLPFQLILAQHSHDGAQLLLQVVGGGDSPARIVNATTGKEFARVPVGSDSDVISWSSDGRYLASVNHAGRVDVWSVKHAVARLFSFSGAPQPVPGSLAMSADGSLVAARGVGEVIVASPATRVLRRLAVPGENVQQLAFSPDSRGLLATLADRSVRVWDVKTGRLRGKTPAHDFPPLVARFSGDGLSIATGDVHSLNLWDAASMVRLAAVDLQTRAEPLAAVFAHHVSRLVTADLFGQVRTWDLLRDRWARALPGQHGWVLARYLGNGARVVTADGGEYGRSRLRIWNATSGKIESSYPIEWDPNCDLIVTTDGSRIALLGRDGRPRILEARSGRVELVLDVPRGEQIWDLSFSPDGHRLAGVSDKSTVYYWSAHDGSMSEVIHDDPKKRWFSSLEFSPDGSQLLLASAWTPVSVWDSTTGQFQHEVPGGFAVVVSYSRDGRRMFTGGLGDRASRIWESNSSKLVTELETVGGIQAASFSPDGSLVASLNQYGQITIWDAATGSELRSMEGPTEMSLPTFSTPMLTGSLEFSPDGKHLLATGPNYALIWNVELDTRSPAQVDAVVAAKSPWRLVDGRLVLRKP